MADLKCAIIGCGNTNRSDDGVGPFVINLLKSRPLPNYVTLHDGGTDGMGVMYQARKASHLVLIDARVPNNHPGAIFEVPGEILEAPPPQSYNLHDFRWDHALYAGKKIYGDAFPRFIKVILIEAERLDLGLSLSDKVKKSAQIVAEKIENFTQLDNKGAMAWVQS
jgi:hydrogenase maturation protease